MKKALLFSICLFLSACLHIDAGIYKPSRNNRLQVYKSPSFIKRRTTTNKASLEKRVLLEQELLEEHAIEQLARILLIGMVNFNMDQDPILRTKSRTF